jgi:hypothetical protein
MDSLLSIVVQQGAADRVLRGALRMEDARAVDSGLDSLALYAGKARGA